VHTLTPAPTPTSSSSTATASSTTSTSSTTSSTGNTTGSTSSTPTTSSSSTILANPDYTSYNWAGYMANSTTYTAIRGSWIVPNPTGNSTATTADATWIGIGGISTSDLIQVGSEDTVSAAGAVSSAVFYELLPASPVYPTTIAISPGDVLTASITEQTTGTWVITITDSTNSQSFTTTVSYPSKNNSAEWIEEDPSYANGSLVPFDNFGTVNFSGASATTPSGSQTISAVHGSSIAMVTQSGTTLAGPTALGSDGASFSVIRQP
ncbi:MAG TPA: G1 family glutamic endopeptidase, partial [Candidatus Saccharimonadales bacterium]|nr:G1 family glutamic endopeptidase [Candidatus Saccharimonadales bacterium]